MVIRYPVYPQGREIARSFWRFFGGLSVWKTVPSLWTDRTGQMKKDLRMSWGSSPPSIQQLTKPGFLLRLRETCDHPNDRWWFQSLRFDVDFRKLRFHVWRLIPGPRKCPPKITCFPSSKNHLSTKPIYQITSFGMKKWSNETPIQLACVPKRVEFLRHVQSTLVYVSLIGPLRR